MTTISRTLRIVYISGLVLALRGARGAEAAEPAKDPLFAAQIVESTLAQVEYLARSMETLEHFGKNTLEQASTVLDMGPDACPTLAKWLKNRRKDWKTRYWVADMLAYVGRADSVKPLMRAVRSEKEHRSVRLRALESVEELWKKYRANTRELRADLESTLSKTRDPKVREQLRRTLNEIDI